MFVKLENGLDVWYRNMPGKLYEVMLIFRNGEAAENKPGVAHLLEHVITDRAGIGADAGPLNYAQSNAVTGNEGTYYYFSSLFEGDVLAAINKLLTLFHNPDFSTLERERAAVVNEMNDKVTSQSKFLRQALEATLPNQYRVVASDSAHRDSVRILTASDLEEYWQTRYVPSNAMLVVQGNISDELQAAIGRRASKIEHRPPSTLEIPPATSVDPQLFEESVRTEDSALVKFHYSVPPVSECGVKGLAVMELTALLLIDHNAPLYKELRDTRNWAYGVSAWYEGVTRNRSMFCVETQVEPVHARKVEMVWDDVIVKFHENGIPQELFDQLKKKLLAQTLTRQSRFVSEMYCDEVGWIASNRITPTNYLQALEQVSQDDVRQFSLMLKSAPRVQAIALPQVVTQVQ